VLLIRRIRQLLYEEGFTISGARHRLDQAAGEAPAKGAAASPSSEVDASALREEIKNVIDSLS